jgi:hypothetical protein
MPKTNNQKKAFGMMREAATALKPILDKYKHHADPRAIEQYEDGLITASELLNNVFDQLYNLPDEPNRPYPFSNE